MKYYVIMLFCVTTTIVTAANNFMGKVVDENNNPLAFVNAILLSQPDSTFIDGGITDDNGDFSLSGNITNAIIKLSCLGYETKHIKTSSFQLGTIAMKPEATLLNEVVVKAVIPTHKLTTEGIKTDVDGTLLSKVGSANDVLENLPGVQKKNDGIEVFGKGTPLIYINGRELRNKNELEQLKSEDIKSVELITNPGAKYKADVESVILIKTKRPQGEGLSFNTQASYYQCDNTDLTLGVNWNYRKGGLDVFGSEWYNEERWDQNDLIRLDVQADTSWVLNEQLKGKSLGRSLYNSIGVNYVLNDNHSMGLRYDTKWVFKDRDWGNMTADIIANDEFFDYLVNTVKHNTKSNMPHTFNAYYNGKIGKTAIDINLDYMFYKDRKKQYNNEISQEWESRIVTAQSVVRNQLLAGKIVLSWPIWGGNLQAGNEVSNSHRNDNYINPEHIVPTSYTKQHERNYTFFAEYARQLPFGQMRVGLRNENVSSDYYIMGERVPEQSRSYHHIFPSVGLSAQAGKVQLMLNYSMKIQRPYYWQLNGNVSYGNRFTWESGNPALKPSINNQLGIMAQWKWMTFMLDYKHVIDPIINVGREVPGSEATTLITLDNVDHADKLRLMLNFNPQFGIYRPQLSLGMIKDWIKIPSPNGFISPRKPLYLIQFNNNIKLLPTLTAATNLNITTKGDQENVTLTRAGVNLYVSLTKTFFNERLSIKVSGRNLLNSQEHIKLRYGMRNLYQEMHRDSRMMEVTINYKFNATSSKWRGTGAGEAEKARFGSNN